MEKDSHYQHSSDEDGLEPYGQVKEIISKNKKTLNELYYVKEKLQHVKLIDECSKKIDEDSFFKLQNSLKYEKVPKNQFLFQQNDNANKFYILLKGEISVMTKADDPTDHSKYLTRNISISNLLEEYQRIHLNRTQKNNLPTEELTSTRVTLGDFIANTIKNMNKSLSNENHSEDTNKPFIRSTRRPSNLPSHEIPARSQLDFIHINAKPPRLKLSRPILKLAYFITSEWDRQIKSRSDLRHDFRVNQDFFEPYDVRFFQNKLLTQLSNFHKIDNDLFHALFPKLDRILKQKEGFSFGDVSLFKKCTRNSTVFCNTDCEFAVISKKYETDFTYLMNWEQHSVHSFMKNFDLFNYWTVRGQLSNVSKFLVQHRVKYGDFVYGTGEKTREIYFLFQGEIELQFEQKNVRKFLDKNDNEKKVENSHSFQGHSNNTFRRLVNAPNSFGIEEFLSQNDNRIFSAVVKSSECIYYSLPIEKILLEICEIHPTFLDNLTKHSCFTNEKLLRGYRMNTLFKSMKEKSLDTLQKKITELQKSFCAKDENLMRRNNSKILKIGFNNSLLKMLKFGNKKKPEIIVATTIKKDLPKSVDNSLTQKQADYIMKNMSFRSKRVKDHDMTVNSAVSFNKNSAICKAIKHESVKDIQIFRKKSNINSILNNIDIIKKDEKNCVKKNEKNVVEVRNALEKDTKKITYNIKENMEVESLRDFRCSLNRHINNLYARKTKMPKADDYEHYFNHASKHNLKKFPYNSYRQKSQNLNEKVSYRSESHLQETSWMPNALNHSVQNPKINVSHQEKKSTMRGLGLRKRWLSGNLRDRKSIKADCIPFAAKNEKNTQNNNSSEKKYKSRLYSTQDQRNTNSQNATILNKSKDKMYSNHLFATQDIRNVKSQNTTILNKSKDKMVSSHLSQTIDELKRKNSQILNENQQKGDIESKLKTLINLKMHNHFNFGVNAKVNNDNIVGIDIQLSRCDKTGNNFEEYEYVENQSESISTSNLNNIKNDDRNTCKIPNSRINYIENKLKNSTKFHHKYSKIIPLMSRSDGFPFLQNQNIQAEPQFTPSTFKNNI